MILYLLYRIGYFIANVFPLKVTYGVACLIADIYYMIAADDRAAVVKNLRVIMGDSVVDDRTLRRMSREVFVNFAKYLADFFRFSKIDDRYIKKFVKLEGFDNIDQAHASGGGVILLSAHLGNWELGGFVLSLTKYPLNAVVLTHKNKRINDFFTKQRSLGKMGLVTLGMSLRGCYTTLKGNGMLALMGDRDFSKNGIRVDFFGRPAVMPKGPAVLSVRLGSPIVPCFLVREKGDRFRLIAEKPIYPAKGMDEDQLVKKILSDYLVVIESYVRRYPTQWYIFREAWSGDKKSLQSDTVI